MKIIDHGSYFPKLSNTILSLVLLIIMSLSTMTASVQAQESNLAELFASAEAARAPESLYFVTRSRFVTVDVGLLSVNTEIVLNLFPDVSFIGVVGNVEQNGQNSTSWIGHLKDVELSNFVLVEADHIFTATISSPEGVYQVKQAEASIYEIQQIDPSKLPGNHIVRSPEPMEEKLSVPEVASGNWPAVDNGSQIDIMVLYTPAAKSYQGSTAAMNSFIDTAISQVNTSYANSGVTPRLRLVYRAEIPYTEDTSNLNSDIERLQAKSDGFMDEIHTLRDTYNADLVSLFTGPTAPYCNATYNMDYVSHSFESLAFSTVNVTCATSNYSFAIALGASQGAQTNEDPDILPYLYAHDYIDVLHDFRTIMANDSASCPGGSCTHLLYWSNPNLTWNGYPMGVPENQPNPAENWKVLNNTAWTVANFRSTDSYEPDDICSQAKVIGLGSQQTHSVSPIGDADWAKFTLTQISNITISTSGFAGDTEYGYILQIVQLYSATMMIMGLIFFPQSIRRASV